MVARQRPPAAIWLAEPEGFSLPSKHTTLAALTAGACACALARAPRQPGRGAAGLGRCRRGPGVPGRALAERCAGRVAVRRRLASPGRRLPRRRQPCRVPRRARDRRGRSSSREHSRWHRAAVLGHRRAAADCAAGPPRSVGAEDDWVLPGGTPRAGESMAACARREVREETGLHVDPARVAFVLEVLGPTAAPAQSTSCSRPPIRRRTEPEQHEPGLTPVFVAVDEIRGLDLRPPLAGHLRGMLSQRGQLYAPYLANLWRPPRERAPGRSAESHPRAAGGWGRRA